MPSPTSAPPRTARRATPSSGPIDRGEASPSTADRSIGRRRSLPGSRAVIGGLLVTLAAVGTFAAYTSATAPPTHHYVVANRPITEGQRFGSDDLRLVALDLPDDLAAHTFTSADQVLGAAALAPLDEGQLVAPAQIRASGADPSDEPRGTDGAPAREFSFAIDRDSALDGRLQRGELVDLVVTYGTGDAAYTSVVVREARVLDVDSSGKGAVGTMGKIVLSVAIDASKELATAHAVEVGKVRLVRSSGLTGETNPSGDGGDTFQPEPPATASVKSAGGATTLGTSGRAANP